MATQVLQFLGEAEQGRNALFTGQLPRLVDQIGHVIVPIGPPPQGRPVVQRSTVGGCLFDNPVKDLFGNREMAKRHMAGGQAVHLVECRGATAVDERDRRLELPAVIELPRNLRPRPGIVRASFRKLGRKAHRVRDATPGRESRHRLDGVGKRFARWHQASSFASDHQR